MNEKPNKNYNLFEDEYGTAINNILLVISLILAILSVIGIVFCLATIGDATGRYANPLPFVSSLVFTMYCISGSITLLWFARTGKNISAIRESLEKNNIK